jgi:hypothetical protein
MWDEADDEAVDGIARQFLERNGADALQMLLCVSAWKIDPCRGVIGVQL